MLSTASRYDVSLNLCVLRPPHGPSYTHSISEWRSAVTVPPTISWVGMGRLTTSARLLERMSLLWTDNFRRSPCGAPITGVHGPSEGPTQPTTTTTAPSVVPISTMLLTFDPKTLQELGGFRVVDHEVDMNKLGRVYSLDGYR